MTVDKAILLSADRGHILKILSSFKGRPTEQWLSAGNPAKKGALPSKWIDVNKISDQHLAEAVAACAPNHCVDGWSYVARSISALLAGDLHATRHLAYYAQLRAALSILGHLGIGVFNGINFVITSTGKVEPFDTGPPFLGTHAAVWQTLYLWVNEAAAARQFLDLVRIGQSSLSN